jgi:ankyrin repeat protein
LTSKSLGYYAEKPGKAPALINEIPLFAIDNVKSLPFKRLQKKHGFSLIFTKQKQTKELVMYATSEKEVEEWVKAINEAKGMSSPRATGSLQREGVLHTSVDLSGDELETPDDEEDSGIFGVKDNKETDITNHKGLAEGSRQITSDTNPEQRSSSPTDSSFSLAVSQSSQGSYLSSSSSGTVSSESSRNSGSFDPCDIPGLMETSESKEFFGDVSAHELSPLELNKKSLAPVLSAVAEEVGSDEENAPPVNTESEREVDDGLQHPEKLDIILQNPEIGDELETENVPNMPEARVFQSSSPVAGDRRKRRSLPSSSSYSELNLLDKLTDGLTQLHIACQQGNIERVKELLQGGANPCILDSIKQQPCLFHAYIHDHKEVLVVLLSHGCDPGIQEQGQGLQLLHMCAQNGDISTAKALLQHGAHVDSKDYREVTPLLMSCEAGKLPMVEFLLENGADVNWLGKGQTALHIASAKGDETLVGLLLKYGANVLITDRPHHQKPFDVAMGNKHEKVAEMLRAAQPEEARAYTCVHTLKGHKEEVSVVACSQVALIASGDVNGTVILWNPVNGSHLHSMNMDNAVVSVSFWKSYLVLSTAVVTVLDLERVGWKLELNTAEDGPLQLVAVSPDGHLAVADIDNNQIELWSTGPVEGFVRSPVRSIVADSVLRDKDGVCHRFGCGFSMLGSFVILFDTV